MGLCTAFGPQIREGCSHPMVAGADACYCAACGVRCNSKFQGCRDVWAGKPAVPAHFIERVAVATHEDAPRLVDTTPASESADSLEPAAQPEPETLTTEPAAQVPAPSPDFNESIAAMGAEQSALRGQIDQLAVTVDRLGGQHNAYSGRENEILAAIGWVKSELIRIEKLAADFESETRQLLDRHRDAIRRVGTRVKKLEQATPPS